MKLSNPFTYFGTKKQSAKYYPKPKKEVRTIFEPFAGGLGYSRHWIEEGLDVDSLSCEVRAELVSAWDFILSADSSEFLHINEVLKPLLTRAQNRELVTSTEAIQALRKAGIRDSGICWALFATRIGGRAPGTFFEGLRCHNTFASGPSAVAVYYQRLNACEKWSEFPDDITEKFQMLNMSYLDLDLDVLDKTTLVFIDPPYQNWPGVYGADQKDFDYNELRAWIEELKTVENVKQIVVCGSAGDDWIEFNRVIKAKQHNKRHVQAASEHYYYWERE